MCRCCRFSPASGARPCTHAQNISVSVSVISGHIPCLHFWCSVRQKIGKTRVLVLLNGHLYCMGQISCASCFQKVMARITLSSSSLSESTLLEHNSSGICSKVPHFRAGAQSKALPIHFSMPFYFYWLFQVPANTLVTSLNKVLRGGNTDEKRTRTSAALALFCTCPRSLLIRVSVAQHFV